MEVVRCHHKFVILVGLRAWMPCNRRRHLFMVCAVMPAFRGCVALPASLLSRMDVWP